MSHYICNLFSRGDMNNKTFGVFNGNAEKISVMLADAGIQASVVGRNHTATQFSVSAGDHARAMSVISLLDSQAEAAGKTFPLWECGMVAGVGVLALVSLGWLPVGLMVAGPWVLGAMALVFVADTVFYNRAWARTAHAHGAKRVAVGAWVVGLLVLVLVGLLAGAVAMVWMQEGVI
jgi:hypothetical protein